jgi:hypothetical protein
LTGLSGGFAHHLRAEIFFRVFYVYVPKNLPAPPRIKFK